MQKHLFSILTWILYTSYPIYAQESITPLATALSQGLKNHPAMLAADSATRIRIAESFLITQRPNPRLEAEFRALTDKPTVELKLMQPLKRSYFGLRQNYAMIEQISAKADAQAQIAAVLNDVYLRYIELWTVQQLQQIHHQNSQDFLSLQDSLHKAINAGQGNNVDLALINAEIAHETTEAKALESQRLSKSAALARSIGSTSDKIIHAENPIGIPIPKNCKILEKFAINRTPLRLALLKREQALRAKLAISRSDRLGPIEAGIITTHDSSRDEVTLGIGFTFDLPLWNRNEAAIANDEATLHATHNQLNQYSPEKISALVRLRYRSAITAQQSAAQYSSEVVPMFEAALLQARKNIAKGQIGVIQILPLITRLTQARTRQFELSINALEARSELEGALGGRLEEALGASLR